MAWPYGMPYPITHQPPIIGKFPIIGMIAVNQKEKYNLHISQDMRKFVTLVDIQHAEELIVEHLEIIKMKWNEIHGNRTSV